MLFYVPSLLPVMATEGKDLYELGEEFVSNPESLRISNRYLASLFTSGDEEAIISVNKKLLAVRMYRRSQTVGDVGKEQCVRMLDEAGTNPEEVEEIYQMISLATFEGRFVIPPFMREMAIESVEDPSVHKGDTGSGYLRKPKRGW